MEVEWQWSAFPELTFYIFEFLYHHVNQYELMLFSKGEGKCSAVPLMARVLFFSGNAFGIIIEKEIRLH